MSGDDTERMKKKSLLLSYYAQNGSSLNNANNANNADSASIATTGSSSSSLALAKETALSTNLTRNPYDINATSFEPDLYLKKLIKEKNLVDIMDIENEIAKETRKLDSEMQTLVSENYNKFISATDTIRKMRSDFKKMEEEMEHLVVGMGEITVFNEKVNLTFKDRREEITRLNNTDNLLKKLQFLFELPAKLTEFMNEPDSYPLAVKYYSKARRTLDHYKHMPTFVNIDNECQQIIGSLKTKLYTRLNSTDSSFETIAESVDLLTRLDEPMDKLCSQYIGRAQKCLDTDLNTLTLNIDLLVSSSKSKNASETSKQNQHIAMDILEFVDYGCNHFLASLSSIIESFSLLFIKDSSQNNQYDLEFSNEIAEARLNSLVKTYWFKYCDTVRRRFEVEQNLGENTIIVRAVDRFYRRIHSINKQIPNVDLSIEASNIALYAALIRVNFYLQVLKAHFNECLIDLRHSVALAGTANTLLPGSSTSSNSNERRLQQLHDTSYKSITEQIKNVLTNLQAFIASDISFSAKVHFNEPFCKDFVRERLLVPYLRHIAQTTKEYADGSHDPVPHALLLILTRLCLEFESVAIDYLLTLTDEQFFISDKSGVTKQRDLCDLFKESAKLLINHYVKARGSNLSLMIRKSVETRDWLNTIEPRNVRAVMKRIVEDFTSIDIQVGELFETGARKEKGSDSSRNTFTTRQTQRSAAWSFTTSNADSKLMNNIQKLFAEKIEIFSPVEFSKVSVLTGIVKITLKTFLECIRLKTFSKYGLQQIQVDCHYLQLYLWRFVNDENLVYFLLEEILTSSIHRCTEPQLMEPRVVEVICEAI